MNEKEYLMIQALKEAKKAYKKLEIPVGAVIVKDGKIIGSICVWIRKMPIFGNMMYLCPTLNSKETCIMDL